MEIDNKQQKIKQQSLLNTSHYRTAKGNRGNIFLKLKLQITSKLLMHLLCSTINKFMAYQNTKTLLNASGKLPPKYSSGNWAEVNDGETGKHNSNS